MELRGELWDALIPTLTPSEGALRDSAPCRGTRCALLWRTRREGAFCEASDKPCSQSRAGSGIISGCARGRNPSLAHRIGFLFTRAWSPDSSNQSRPRTAGDREERGSVTALVSRLSVCLSVCLSLSQLKKKHLRMHENLITFKLPT